MGNESFLEKIFSHWVLLFINVAILILVELTGTFFMETGLIHLIAILFIILGASRIFVHYDIHDQFLKPFIISGIIALLLLSVSHILEYASYAYFFFPYETVAANVANLYLASLLMIASGIIFFLSRVEKNLVIFKYIFPAGAAVCLIATIIFFLYPTLFPKIEWLQYFYLTIVIGVAFVASSQLIFLKRHVSIMVNFINYFNAAFLLMAVATLLYILNEPLEELSISYMQVMYISHFLFYGALSLMFLAYSKFANLGGIYAEVEKLKANNTTS